MELHQLHLLLEKAKEAALLAGAYIEFAKKDFTIHEKKSGTSNASQIVTEVDFGSQEIILNQLKETSTAFNLGLLIEELSDDNSRFEKEYFWCIDPLDGTLPFTEGTDGYSVSIALVSKAGGSLLGVIYDSFNKVLYEAIKGEGAKRNSEVFQVKNSGATVTLVMDRSFSDHPKFHSLVNALGKDSEDEVTLIQHGGAALNAMWVLEHSPACYVKFPKPNNGGGSLWDFAASSLIVKEAGGVVTAFDGSSLKLNTKNTFMNEQGIVCSSINGVDVILQKMK